MNFTPIQQRDLSFHVYVQIREMILSGELKAGEKLPQEKIAAQLGVSRMPLHKAFIMLEEEFLVESIPRRGIFIRKPDIRSIMEAFECREGLEGVAARRAAENFTDKEINDLEEMFVPFHNQQEIVQYDYQMADQAFHEAIIAASGNIVMQKLNSIGSVLIRTYPKGIILPIPESLEDHRMIITAFRNRDAAGVEELVRNHSRKARLILEKELEKELENKPNKLK